MIFSRGQVFTIFLASFLHDTISLKIRSPLRPASAPAEPKSVESSWTPTPPKAPTTSAEILDLDRERLTVAWTERRNDSLRLFRLAQDMLRREAKQLQTDLSEKGQRAPWDALERAQKRRSEVESVLAQVQKKREDSELRIGGLLFKICSKDRKMVVTDIHRVSFFEKCTLSPQSASSTSLQRSSPNMIISNVEETEPSEEVLQKSPVDAISTVHFDMSRFGEHADERKKILCLLESVTCVRQQEMMLVELYQIIDSRIQFEERLLQGNRIQSERSHSSLSRDKVKGNPVRARNECFMKERERFQARVLVLQELCQNLVHEVLVETKTIGLDLDELQERKAAEQMPLRTERPRAVYVTTLAEFARGAHSRIGDYLWEPGLTEQQSGDHGQLDASTYAIATALAGHHISKVAETARYYMEPVLEQARDRVADTACVVS